KSGTGNILKWTSLDEKNQVWFDGNFQLDNYFNAQNAQSASHPKVVQTLKEILVAARKLNPDFLSKKSGIEVVTKLNFPRNWGLGSSSTLINNIAQWAKVDAFALHKNSFGGSGYDIACAQSDVAIVFSNKQTPPIVIQIEQLEWPFTDVVFFVYLNKKQDSKQSILHYNQLGKEKKEFIEKANHITREFLEVKTLKQF